MLIFWNLAGVPLSYCHCALYLANHLDTVTEWKYPAARTPLLVLLFTTYLFVYWVWDLAGSQKRELSSFSINLGLSEVLIRYRSLPRTTTQRAHHPQDFPSTSLRHSQEPSIPHHTFWRHDHHLRCLCLGTKDSLYLRCLLCSHLGIDLRVMGSLRCCARKRSVSN